MRAAADSVALPAVVDGRYDAAVVSATVASLMRHQLSRHSISVSPSGHFPSVLMRPAGPLVAGMPARERERCIMSFACLRQISQPDER